MNKQQLNEKIEKILGNKLEFVTKAGENMIWIQLNRKNPRLAIYGIDIKELEQLGLRLWNINFDTKVVTMDIVKK